MESHTDHISINKSIEEKLKAWHVMVGRSVVGLEQQCLVQHSEVGVLPCAFAIQPRGATVVKDL